MLSSLIYAFIAHSLMDLTRQIPTVAFHYATVMLAHTTLFYGGGDCCLFSVPKWGYNICLFSAPKWGSVLLVKYGNKTVQIMLLKKFLDALSQFAHWHSIKCERHDIAILSQSLLDRSEVFNTANMARLNTFRLVGPLRIGVRCALHLIAVEAKHVLADHSDIVLGARTQRITPPQQRSQARASYRRVGKQVRNILLNMDRQ